MLKQYSYSRVENNVKKEGRSEKHKYCKESSRHLEQDDFSFYIAFNLCISSFSLSDKEANPWQDYTGEHQVGELQNISEDKSLQILFYVLNLQNPFVGRQVENLAWKPIDVDAEGEHQDQLHDKDEEHGEDGGDHEARGGGGERLEGVVGDRGCQQLCVGLGCVLHNDGHDHNQRDNRRHAQDGCKPCEAPSEK